MKKRIYAHFIGLAVPIVLLLTVILCFLFYNAFKDREMAALQDSAGMVADLLDRGVASEELSDYATGGSLRITIVAPGGQVLLDNKIDAGTMENHGSREEIVSAVQTGTGETVRVSGTFSAETYYCAVRLENGNILRLSKTLESIVGIFLSSLPVVAGITVLLLLVSHLLARKLTAHILRPLAEIDLESDNIAVYDELLPYVKKIDSQKREIAGQMSALRHRTETIEAVVGNMREGLLLLDQTGAVMTANKSAAEVFGIADITGRSILHVCRDIELGQGVRRCLAGESAELALERGERSYGVFCSPVRSEAGGAVVLLLDITEKRESERQRREFSANVSHELKTPLTAISALSEMIGNGMARDGDIKLFAARISEQAGRLINMIDDIIRLSEFDEGGVAAEMTEFDLYELAQSVTDTFRDNDKAVTLSLTGERIVLFANRRMLDELLYNLIDNAVKYNRDNGSVEVTLRRESGFCKIEVSDTGIGIPAEHHARVFERFYRVDKSRSKKTGGTGLGLSIVKHIAAYHGGGVEIESAAGEGTTVTCSVLG
jgi:two-component system phosphate regulon sensor histidine kinase PhoR